MSVGGNKICAHKLFSRQLVKIITYNLQQGLAKSNGKFHFNHKRIRIDCVSAANHDLIQG